VPLLECVPNVSEGRDRAVLDRLAACVRATPGVRLADIHFDAVHHRSVYTMLGPPAALHAAVLALCEAAIGAIDLTRHAGAHPRIGAVDVVPFVPVGGAPMADAVVAARAAGMAIAARFGLPVLFYGEAATASHRRPLEAVRRGQFEGLAARLTTPEWHPDAGPATPHPTAGAVAVGARPILVAFNVNLATRDLAIARTVARAVRESSGGLPAVKAMGLTLPERGLVQVSMNLTDIARTPPRSAFEAVAREAGRHGIAVAESELVGLAPTAALTADDARAMRVAGWHSGKILETYLG
jgi:glutamate formiminotransferase